MANKWLLLLISVLPFTSCGQQQETLNQAVEKLYKNTVPLASVTQAETWSNAWLLDTREPREFEVSHLPNAQLVGYKKFDAATVEHIPKTDTIIVYCSVGYRSERIGETLKKKGYQYVYNLYGGIFNWVNNNKVVVNASSDTTARIHAYNKAWGLYLNKGEKVYD